MLEAAADAEPPAHQGPEARASFATLILSSCVDVFVCHATPNQLWRLSTLDSDGLILGRNLQRRVCVSYGTIRIIVR